MLSLDSPAFERCVKKTSYGETEYWAHAEDYEIPECHPGDKAFVMSLIYNKDFKQDGMVFEKQEVSLSKAQRDTLIKKYSEAFAAGSRRDANNRLRIAIDNIKSRI